MRALAEAVHDKPLGARPPTASVCRAAAAALAMHIAAPPPRARVHVHLPQIVMASLQVARSSLQAGGDRGLVRR